MRYQLLECWSVGLLDTGLDATENVLVKWSECSLSNMDFLVISPWSAVTKGHKIFL